MWTLNTFSRLLCGLNPKKPQIEVPNMEVAFKEIILTPVKTDLKVQSVI